ncbi:MAG: NAD(P)H-hydrate dehydratase [Parachlamydiaceae bacterium]|nr:NAD(P)H-hydrate dehydratase [Parachlamydiaceae bacterium]
MKVVSPQQMADLEALAYRDGASESDFMEEAGSGVALIANDYVEHHDLNRQIILLCGKGNNAGDTYVAGIQLLHLEYEVTAYQILPLNDASNLCKQNHFAFLQEGGRLKDINSVDDLDLPASGLIIDGLFGTGFRGTIEGNLGAIIQAVNDSHLPIIAVDIPSGLNGETGKVGGTAIVATITAYLGLPKTGFFLNEGWNHVGILTYVDFGLSKSYVADLKTPIEMLSPDLLKPWLPAMRRNRHKYQAGHVITLAGSLAMPGAGLLCSLSCLCSGAGIVRLLYPMEMEAELTAIPYELIKVPYDSQKTEPMLELMNHASAVIVGPGLGLSPTTRSMLKKIIPNIQKPCVLDADALTVIAEENITIPAEAILTPHIGELKRLLKVDTFTLDKDGLKRCADYAAEHRITLIVKGGPTFIFHAGEVIYVNPKGDPGMATAGSGDVLTGLLASLLAQGVPSGHAAALGVYLHGLAGEFAAAELTSYCMTASDMITYFPHAFRVANWTE